MEVLTLNLTERVTFAGDRPFLPGANMMISRGFVAKACHVPVTIGPRGIMSDTVRPGLWMTAVAAVSAG